MSHPSEPDPPEKEIEELLGGSPAFLEKMRDFRAYQEFLDGEELPKEERQVHLGDYRLIREIGRGGMGLVYEAWQESLGRRIALKIIAPDLLPNRRAIERFRTEARITSKIDHPGICTVYDAGLEDGVPYIAMRYIEGETLAEKLSQRTADRSNDLAPATGDGVGKVSRRDAEAEGSGRVASVLTDQDSIDERVALIEKSARALHVAHEAGFIHRDIKPSNIMIADSGEPVVLDFGTAREMEVGAGSMTQSGDILGTPAYMSPEQIEARRQRIDRRTDVYSLGATLYECVTLCRPFDAPTREGLFHAILKSAPPNCRLINGGISKDLKVVIETALDKNLDRRYQTALDFAEDLRRVREYEPILARPAGAVVRFRRWTRRSPALATATVALIVLLVTGLSMSLAFINRLDQEISRVKTLAENERAALVRSEGLRLAAQSSVLRDTNPGQALILAIEATQRYPGRVTRSALLSAVLETREEKTLLGNRGRVACVNFSPDGKRVVTASHVHPFRPGIACVWDCESGQELFRLESPGRFGCAKFSPDGRKVFTASGDQACLWDARTGARLGVIPLQGTYFRHGDFHPDGKRIVIPAHTGATRLWDIEERKLIRHLDGQGAAHFSPSGDRLVTISGAAAVRVWETATYEEVLTVVPGGRVSCATLSPEGKHLLVAVDSVAVIFDAETGKELRRFAGHGAGVTAANYGPDGSRVVTASNDNTARLWDAETGAELFVLRGHESGLFWATFSPDGRRVATASRDGTARLWDVGIRNDLLKIQEKMNGASFHPDGRQVVTALAGGTACVWDAATWKKVATLIGHEAQVNSATFSPDGTQIVTASHDGTARVWDAEGNELRSLVGHQGRVHAASFSADGSMVGTASEDRTVRIWSASGEKLRIYEDSACRCVTFSPDGSRVVSGNWGGSVTTWSAETGAKLQIFDRHSDSILSVAFDPVGERVVTASYDGTVRIWRADNGEELAVLEGHRGEVLQASFNADGRRVVSGSRDNTARIWNAESGEELLTFRGHESDVNSATFRSDGRYVLTTSRDGTARIWPLDPSPLAMQRRPRDLTPEEMTLLEVGTPEERKAHRETWNTARWRRDKALLLASEKDAWSLSFLQVALKELQDWARSFEKAGRLREAVLLLEEALPLTEYQVVKFPTFFQTLREARRDLLPDLASYASADALLDSHQVATLVPDGAEWHFFRGKSEPPANWTAASFEAESWEVGRSGFGYEDGDDTTVLDDMRGSYTTLYIRRRFELADPGRLKGLQLTIDFDDGFVAYLNGEEVASFNAADVGGSGLPFDAVAARQHEALAPMEFDLQTESLRAGANVLAIHGLNRSAGSSDFSLKPSLRGTEVVPAALEEVRRDLEAFRAVASGDTGERILAYFEARVLEREAAAAEPAKSE